MRIKVNSWMDLDVHIFHSNENFMLTLDKIDTSETNKPFLSSRQEYFLSKDEMRALVDYINGETNGKI